jgi:AcrR family transcriptional regulator
MGDMEEVSGASEPVSRRGRPAKPPLSRGAIVDAALSLAQRDGVPGVTLRAVARALDTGPASIYVYFANRDELLGRMLERALADVPTSAVKSKRWRRRLLDLYAATVQALDRYPGLAAVALEADPLGGPGAQAITDNAIALMRTREVPEATAAWGCEALLLFTLGAAAHPPASGASRSADESERFARALGALIQGIREA